MMLGNKKKGGDWMNPPQATRATLEEKIRQQKENAAKGNPTVMLDPDGRFQQLETFGKQRFPGLYDVQPSYQQQQLIQQAMQRQQQQQQPQTVHVQAPPQQMMMPQQQRQPIFQQPSAPAEPERTIRYGGPEEDIENTSRYGQEVSLTSPVMDLYSDAAYGALERRTQALEDEITSSTQSVDTASWVPSYAPQPSEGGGLVATGGSGPMLTPSEIADQGFEDAEQPITSAEVEAGITSEGPVAASSTVEMETGEGEVPWGLLAVGAVGIALVAMMGKKKGKRRKK